MGRCDMRIEFVIVRLFILMSLSLSVCSGPAGAAESDTIVVNGQRLTKEEARARATDFVRRLGVVQGDRPAARWASRICLKVKGVSTDIAHIVETRMTSTIQAVGARAATGNCTTNLLVAFVSDGQELAALVNERQPASMTDFQGPERRELLEGDAPVRWWYTIAYGSSDGDILSSTPSPVTSGNVEGGGSILPDGVPTGGSYAPSLVRSQVIRLIRAATVIIDVNRAEGITLNAAADYAAFVGLAEVRRNSPVAVRSIINLFSPEYGSESLTDWDLWFLTKLYTIPLNRLGRLQRGYLVKALVDDGDIDESE